MKWKLQILSLMYVISSIFVLLISDCVFGQQQFIHSEMTHLRSGNIREWNNFPQVAYGNKLRIPFQGKSNKAPVTIGMRRIDVKEDWRVTINETLLANLFSDENDMQEAWELAPGTLKEGENILVIEPKGEVIDDIMIGQIWLDMRPRSEIFRESRLNLTAFDENGNRTPCRFTILDSKGALAIVEPATNAHDQQDHLALRSGVAYSSTGHAELGVVPGAYRVMCSRGFEYSLDQSEFSLSIGEKSDHAFNIKRVVDTKGFAACDTHVHTFEISRHGDSSLRERMITLAGEGIEIAAATDHNTIVDYRPYLKERGLTGVVTPIFASEITTRAGHFNVFPLSLDQEFPNYQTTSWDELFASINKNRSKSRVAILNHPRDKHSGFVPFGPENMIDAVGERSDGRRLQANAIELINSAALRSDPFQVFHDWLTQINRGLEITAVGSSDSHEVSRKIVGQGRTYVNVDDSKPGEINVVNAVDSIISGRALVSLGLLVELSVDEKGRAGDTIQPNEDSLKVRVRVQGPEWIAAERIEIFVNGELERAVSLTNEEGKIAGVKKELQFTMDLPSQDIHLVAIAIGPGVTSLHWPIAKPYQPSSPEWRSYVFASSGIVRIDCDRDGRWSSVSEYADKAIEGSGEDFESLLKAIARFDIPTASFAAHLWSSKYGSLREPSIAKRLKDCPEAIQEGFERYILSQRASMEATQLPASKP